MVFHESKETMRTAYERSEKLKQHLFSAVQIWESAPNSNKGENRSYRQCYTLVHTESRTERRKNYEQWNQGKPNQ